MPFQMSFLCSLVQKPKQSSQVLGNRHSIHLRLQDVLAHKFCVAMTPFALAACALVVAEYSEAL